MSEKYYSVYNFSPFCSDNFLASPFSDVQFEKINFFSTPGYCFAFKKNSSEINNRIAVSIGTAVDKEDLSKIHMIYFEAEEAIINNKISFKKMEMNKFRNSIIGVILPSLSYPSNEYPENKNMENAFEENVRIIKNIDYKKIESYFDNNIKFVKNYSPNNQNYVKIFSNSCQPLTGSVFDDDGTILNKVDFIPIGYVNCINGIHLAGYISRLETDNLDLVMSPLKFDLLTNADMKDMVFKNWPDGYKMLGHASSFLQNKTDELKLLNTNSEIYRKAYQEYIKEYPEKSVLNKDNNYILSYLVNKIKNSELQIVGHNIDFGPSF